MAVPKKRLPKGRRNKRRMHLYLKAPVLTNCPKCGKPILAHTACSNCGYYKGAEIIDVLKKLTKKERKKKEKEIKTEEEEKEKAGKKSLTWEEMSKK